MNTAIRACMGIIALAAAATLSACILAGDSAFGEIEPNDTVSEANDLGTLGTETVYAKLSESDSTDYFHFAKGSETIVEFEIVTMASDMDSAIEYTLTGGASPVYGYSAEYKYLSGQSSYHAYDLKVTLDSDSNGGSYVVMIRCRS
jgi:hypothetical protein